MRATFTSATCSNCETSFSGLPVEYDGDNGYAVLEVKPCAGPACDKLLCACCDQFHCDGCGDTFCASHMISIPDGTPTPLHCCPTCAAESEPVVSCPVCASYQVSIEACDFGSDPETGYHDAGERFRCRACGAVGDTEELVSTPVVPAELPARIGPGREVRYGRQAELWPGA